MDHLTFTRPKGYEALDAAERAKVESQVNRLLAEAVAEHAQAQDRGALMDLYGSLSSDIPRSTDEEELAAAQRYVAENYTRDNP